MPVGPRALALADWLAFPSLLPAGVAAALLLAASRAMGLPPDWIAAALAGSGTLVVYNIDRLRDVDADRATTPLRTAFIERHRAVVLALTIGAAAVSIALLSQTSREIQLLCAGVLATGLLHRRIKRAQVWKVVYVTVAWVCVTAGMPALGSSEAANVGWVASVYATAIGANLLATRLRAATQRPILWLSRGLALAGVFAAALAPTPVQLLAAIPATQLLALAAFRPGERYGLVIVDGALLAGALICVSLE